MQKAVCAAVLSYAIKRALKVLGIFPMEKRLGARRGVLCACTQQVLSVQLKHLCKLLDLNKKCAIMCNCFFKRPGSTLLHSWNLTGRISLKLEREFCSVFVFTALNAKSVALHISMRAGGTHKSLSCTVALVREEKLLFKDYSSSFNPKKYTKGRKLLDTLLFWIALLSDSFHHVTNVEKGPIILQISCGITSQLKLLLHVPQL